MLVPNSFNILALILLIIYAQPCDPFRNSICQHDSLATEIEFMSSIFHSPFRHFQRDVLPGFRLWTAAHRQIGHLAIIWSLGNSSVHLPWAKWLLNVASSSSTSESFVKWLGNGSFIIAFYDETGDDSTLRCRYQRHNKLSKTACAIFVDTEINGKKFPRA